MDRSRFDALARSFIAPSPRRALVHLLAGTAVAGALVRPTPSTVESNRRKRPCKACRKKNKTRCKKQANLGVGTVCDESKCKPGATSSCSTNNDFCAQQWAYCLEAPECGCFMTVEGDPICGNILEFSGCPATTECTTSADCGGETAFCVDLSCCPEGKAACRPLCVT